MTKAERERDRERERETVTKLGTSSMTGKLTGFPFSPINTHFSAMT